MFKQILVFIAATVKHSNEAYVIFERLLPIFNQEHLQQIAKTVNAALALMAPAELPEAEVIEAGAEKLADVVDNLAGTQETTPTADDAEKVVVEDSTPETTPTDTANDPAAVPVTKAAWKAKAKTA